jgi:protease PrsW
MSDLLILMAGAALPSLLIIIWFYRMDRLRPEPVGLIGRSVLFGFLAAAPAIAIELVVDLPASALPFPLSIIWTAFITAALVEEGVKYFFLKRYLYANKHFDEVMDGILYAVCVSLGFAFAENILYGLGDRNALLLRAFTAVPMHAAATGIMGYYLGLAKRSGPGPESKALARRGFWAAVAIHGFYDVFLFTGSMLAFAALFVLAFALRHLRSLVKEALRIDRVDDALSLPRD